MKTFQQYGVDEKALAKFFKSQGPPEAGTKRYIPVLLDVEKQEGSENVHRFVITTPDEDRESDILVPDGIKLEHYLKNPVVLWAHDYWGLPIGRSLKMDVGPKNVRADVEYAPTEFAQQVRLLVSTGFLKGSSIGFNPLKWEVRQDQARVDQWGYAYPGYKYLEWELLEWSIVAVPCNPFALLEEAKTKGLRVDEIERLMKANTPKTGLTVPANLAGKQEPESVPSDAGSQDTKGIRKRPRLGKPFGEYEDFDDCVAQNSDKDNPEAYCAALHHAITGEWPGQAEGQAWIEKMKKAAEAFWPGILMASK